MVRKRCLIVRFLIAALFLGVTGDAVAQDSTTSSPRGCWRGRPKPACDMFLLTELNYFRSIVNPSARYTTTYASDSVPVTYTNEIHPSEWKFSAEVGGMINRGKKTGIGGTLLLDASPDGASIGLKARYRRWLTPDGIALDVGAGFRTTRDDTPGNYSFSSGYGPFPRQPSNSIGFTGDVALNARDYVAIVSRVDVSKYDNRLQPTVSLGVRAESRPAVIALAGIGVTYAVLIALLVSAFDN
ncbi:MAG: hypothetical protein ABI120_21750 [Gemmatimonadaceae bacterium]